MPKIVIDEIEIEVEEGLNIIQAASVAGIEIPHFCYHPALSIVAQCRQCLVEVEGVPKVLPACNTFVREGLVVKTKTEKALNARKAAVEFTLINHPLDCPICDKGGECPLQLTTFKHGPGYSRFDGPEEKKVRRKYYLSDKIIYDPNRCIMCTRCVRFTDEVTKTGELGTEGRGFRKKIVTFPGQELNNELSGNVVDLCPVGALLSKDTLHKERVWYWKLTDTICPLCSTGCNITVGTDWRTGRIERVKPKINRSVNDFWICDHGRYGFRKIQEEKRLREPILKDPALENSNHEIIGWDVAISKLHYWISSLSISGNKKIAIIASSFLTNEELYLLRKLHSYTEIDYMASFVMEPQREKNLGLVSDDRYPNRMGVKSLGISTEIEEIIDLLLQDKLAFLLVCGIDLFDIVEEEQKTNIQKALDALNFLAVIDFKLTDTVKFANLILPAATPYEKEGTFTNDAGRIQKIAQTINPPGTAKPEWEILTSLGKRFAPNYFDYENPENIFSDIAKEIPCYRDINYDIIGPLGTTIKIS